MNNTHNSVGSAATPTTVLWLQGVTIGWMLIETAVSLYSAQQAHSTALLAFGSDSLVELLSATIVLISFRSTSLVGKEHAERWAGILLLVLAAIVAITSIASLVHHVQPQTSILGIGITIGALIVMPLLAWRKREIAQSTDNRVLAADAVQSATCAYLAALTLCGLVINAAFHVHWVDAVAALAALPILWVEGRRAMRGESCGCG
jgi:divalent metal cation (Fe/Co/Zn/Cd) transporter